MSLSRRSFFNAVGLAEGMPLSAALLAARGREAAVAAADSATDAELPINVAEIRIDSNENPLGPGRAAMEAFVRAFPDACRYPTNARPSMADLREEVARRLPVRPENVALGAGSWELLRTAVRLYTSSSRHLVTAAPTFEAPERMAEQLGVPVKRVPVDAFGRLDLDRMAQAARWAGLVFFCNPNNPTGGVHSANAVAEFVTRVRRESPETAILIDEAYHDYVAEPAYATALPLVLEHPGVVLTRTFSKAYGMAGLRVGYGVGQARTIEAFNRWAITFNQNSPSVAAAIAALGDPGHIEAERARNAEVRRFTTGVFQGLGCKVLPSETNFVFVDIGRPAKAFKEACAKQQVMVGREFPPFEKTHARISLGTLEEMKRASDVFSEVFGKSRLGDAAGSGSARTGN
jgi:histidinol-phosphate aminotransferase